MRVLLLGGGGREHALGWRLAMSPDLTELVSAPGNPGLAELGPTLPDLDPCDPDAVVEAARSRAVDLVVVGPEAPLAAGVVDRLRAAGIPAFGPDRYGARLEASKWFAKEVMAAAEVPTGRARRFTDLDAAVGHLRAAAPPYVVKADGLAAGKGVLVTDDLVAAADWARRCLEGELGDAGRTVVIEEHLAGPEVSVFALCAGERSVVLEPARDYKRLLDGDEGPNTGGMGAYSPVRALEPDLPEQVRRDVVQPVLAELARRGHPFVGFLYVGLVLTADGPKVLEFNVRLGDPETQVLMPRLATDLLPVLARATEGVLPDTLAWRDDTAVDVVLAAAGYPASPRRGDRIDGLERVDPSVLVFHAGTTRDPDGHLVTAGGRVLNVVGVDPDPAAARRKAYEAAEAIAFEGKVYRRDIAAELIDEEDEG